MPTMSSSAVVSLEDHPRLDVKVTFPTLPGRDSGRDDGNSNRGSMEGDDSTHCAELPAGVQDSAGGGNGYPGNQSNQITQMPTATFNRMVRSSVVKIKQMKQISLHDPAIVDGAAGVVEPQRRDPAVVEPAVAQQPAAESEVPHVGSPAVATQRVGRPRTSNYTRRGRSQRQRRW